MKKVRTSQRDGSFRLEVKEGDSIFLGVDPGKSGGIALVNSTGHCISSKMQATERDIWRFFEAVSDLMDNGNRVMALIEQVHSMPKQGVVSTFKFGMSYGGLRMALIASDIPFESVLPRKWQRGLDIPQRKATESGTQWKNRLKAKAQELFPFENITLHTADAILIAEYLRRTKTYGKVS